MAKTYTPIGTAFIEIVTIGGKPARCHSLESALALLDAAKAEYGVTTTIQSYQVSHGHSNRDWVYTPDMRTHYKLVYEGPVYSREDNVSMAVDRINQAYKALMAPPKAKSHLPTSINESIS